LNVIFRVDASKDIGIGHLMRCLALSEELIRRKHNCFFLSKVDNNELINRIEKNNIIYHKIPSNFSLQADLEMLLKISNENDIDWVITDHYGITSQYIKEIKNKNLRVLSIDDSAQIHYYSDIIVNQNIGAEKLVYSSEKYSKFLLGTKYIILRDELLQRNKRPMKNKVEKILVMFGGADPDNVTLKILKMLETLNENIQFLIVAGPANQFNNYILNYLKNCKMDIKYLRNQKKMSEVYLQSDVAISAGGTSCYELAYFGIPSIIISIADNQIKVAQELENRNISLYLGRKNEIKSKKLLNNIKLLINNNLIRQNMSDNAKKLIDGKGKYNIINFMGNEN
jgi:UDP-2,4-diacetamido-2,4,6-trideoxy-beta-L-altropyranose hydrolase